MRFARRGDGTHGRGATPLRLVNLIGKAKRAGLTAQRSHSEALSQRSGLYSPIPHAAATDYFASFDPSLRHVGEALVRHAVEEVLPKGAPVVSAGEVAQHFYYVDTGLLKHYVQRGRHEMTTWLSMPGELAASFASMSEGVASLETVSAVEETRVLRFEAAALAEAYREVEGAERLGRLITERYFARMATRLYQNTLLSAGDRYVALLEASPELLQRVPLGVLAGYLGMTQETLSRVRRRLAERGRAS